MLRTKKIVRSIRGGMKYIRIIVSSLLVIVGLLIFVNFASSFFFKSSLFNAYIVQSGSMEPAIKTGSLVISLPSQTYSQNDIITYKVGKKLVTHRIEVKLFPEGVYGDPIYMTSGDANKDFDRIKLSQDQIVGKVLFSVPYLGYAADFAKTPKGFILFIVIPATIIVYEELKFLFNSIISRIREKFKKNGLNNITSIGINSKLIAVIPIFGAIIVFVGLTNSFFSDSEISTQNVMQAGVFATPTPTSTPTPTPVSIATHVVVNEVNYKVDDAHTINDEGDSEWFEIYNPTGFSVELTGWSITDNFSCDNFPGTISLGSHSFAIVTPLSEANFKSVWLGVPAGTIFITISAPIGNGLANNDKLDLKDNTCPNGTSVDRISWGNDISAFNPGIGIVADGHSSERDPDGKDTDTAADFVDRSVPTPGT